MFPAPSHSAEGFSVLVHQEIPAVTATTGVLTSFSLAVPELRESILGVAEIALCPKPLSLAVAT